MNEETGAVSVGSQPQAGLRRRTNATASMIRKYSSTIHFVTRSSAAACSSERLRLAVGVLLNKLKKYVFCCDDGYGFGGKDVE